MREAHLGGTSRLEVIVDAARVAFLRLCRARHGRDEVVIANPEHITNSLEAPRAPNLEFEVRRVRRRRDSICVLEMKHVLRLVVAVP